ncbi:MAG: aromatic amino acid transport family protein [Parachlamydiales bacterium]|jgi:tyrosine-specific transport protein
MKIANKFFGSILLISGTTIGAGMLGLPVLTSFSGFFPSIIVFVVFWIYTLTTAFLLLEANLTFEGNVNLITMSEKTLGFLGKSFTWVFYLLLLYSLSAAYMAGSAPLFAEAIKFLTGYELQSWARPLPLLVFFGVFVYLGAKPADYVNRMLMTGLVVSYLVLAFFLPKNVDFNLLKHFDFPAIAIAFPIVLTSFGYHVVIPTLTTYMRHDVKRMKLAIIIGSAIPLLIYVFWEFMVLGIVKLDGSNGLVNMYYQGESSTSSLVNTLAGVGGRKWIATASNYFSFFAIVTSFIGITLSLTDFISDGFKLKKNKKGRLLACIITFLPPVIFLYGYQSVFLNALQYAGIFVAILLGIMPALMVWKLKSKIKFYNTFWGKTILICVILGGVIIIGFGIAEKMGYLNSLIKGY